MVGPCAPSATVSRSGAAPAVLRIALLLAAVCTITIACGQNAATLANLDNLDQLREQFNQDAGKPRLVLLLSPT